MYDSDEHDSAIRSARMFAREWLKLNQSYRSLDYRSLDFETDGNLVEIFDTQTTDTVALFVRNKGVWIEVKQV